MVNVTWGIGAVLALILLILAVIFWAVGHLPALVAGLFVLAALSRLL